MKKIAVCQSTLFQKRGGEDGYAAWLRQHDIPYEYLDCYDSGVISKLGDYSALIWHYSNFMNADLMEAQHILDIAASKGLKVYPDHNTAWHFDDKIAEMYALQSVNAPIPKAWVFYDLERCLNWLGSEAKYPLVAKLRRGSGSNNVKLLKNAAEAKHYARHMFSRGYSPAQSLVYKTYSKAQSTHSVGVLKSRIKKIPKFLKSWKYSKGMSNEIGYCYFQEFIENTGYDIKVAVVGDKCSFLTRRTRKGSFKASGSGDITYQKEWITEDIVRSAFETSEKLNTQCMGYDYVVREADQKGFIVEMCHGFDHEAIADCKGYWDRDLVWHDEPLNVVTEVLEMLVKECEDDEKQ